MIISVIVSIVIWGCIAALLLRTISASGIAISQNKVTAFLLADKNTLKQDAADTNRNFLFIMLAAFIFRIIVFALSYLAVSLFKDGSLTFKGLVQQYVQWDANNYQRIADLGYGGYNENGDFTTLAFFPLYPWTARIFKGMFGSTYISLLAVSFVCYAVGCGFLYKLVSIDYSSGTAVKAVILISVFPHSLFFGTMMNESMFFMFTVITLYYIRSHKWWLVGIFGALASLSRLAGIILAFPALFEFTEHYKLLEKLKSKKTKETVGILLKKGSPVFIMLIGTFIYLYCNYRTTGEWFKFMEYQQRIWKHQSTYFGVGISNIVKNAADAVKSNNSALAAEIHIPSVVSVVFVLVMIVYGLRRGRSMYSIYLIMYFMVNMSVDWIISAPRYMSCAVPAFIYLAEFADKHSRADKLITVSMAIGFGIYLTAYLFGKQIL